ncbi:MAG: ABC transporter ATP-binding protein [Planctomycetota bacterium]|nr:ABC transporter ATP-binding protein [Planctomycetota bacterium]
MTQTQAPAATPKLQYRSTPNDDGLAVNLQNVTKIYGRRLHALAGIAMDVRRGEIFGLLGPNGAGKSTLVKIMLTVVRPTRADGTILGMPVGHKPTLSRVGYLPENHRYPRYLTGRQVVEFFAALSNVDRPTRQRRASELLETVGMSTWADTRINQYSKGMMQRVGLATAMGADPDLIVLDEPTDGVDPAGRRDIRDVLIRLRDEGKTVFVNSHLLSELETVCDRVAILVKGRVASQGTLDELTVGKQFYLFEVSSNNGAWNDIASAFPGAFDPAALAAKAAGQPGKALRGMLPDQTWCEFDGTTLHVGKTDAGVVQDVIDALRRQAMVIRRVQLLRPTLEDLFLEAVGANNSAVPGAESRP